MDVLTTICQVKQRIVSEAKQQQSMADLRRHMTNALPIRSFSTALRSSIHKGQIGLIAELKKASPSNGLIRSDFAVEPIARAYEKGGACCLSVLTDTAFFQGDNSYVALAKEATSLPILRKDFIIDPYQVVESRVIGADCILLIMAAINDEMARELEDVALECGLDILIEVHNEEELVRALTLRSPLIGINNRDLKTLKIDLATTERLRPLIPQDRLVICESGIQNHHDITRMQVHDVNCFLVGESLMRQTDIETATRQLLLG
jgi:indole-3-glycerol phosphate synthase